jgi:hypothetical protein
VSWTGPQSSDPRFGDSRTSCGASFFEGHISPGTKKSGCPRALELIPSRHQVSAQWKVSTNLVVSASAD